MSNAPASVRAAGDELLAAHPLPHDLYVRFASCLIQVRSNHLPLLNKLKDYYKEFLGQPAAPTLVVQAIEMSALSLGYDWTIKTPDPGKTKIKEEYKHFKDGRIVRKRLTDMVFFLTEDFHLAAGPCEANDNQIVNFINNRFIQWLLHRDGLLCHASGVSHNNRGICMAGFSGMGKSTLSLHLMNHGLDFISNDRMIVREVDGALSMYGIPKHPRINPGTILSNPSLLPILTPEEKAEFSALPQEELWNLEHKFDGLIDVCYGPNRFRLAAELAGVVILNWQRNNDPPVLQQVDLNHRRDLLVALKKQPGLFYLPLPGEDSSYTDDSYVKLLSETPVYELSGGANFERAAELCLPLMAPH